MTENALSILIVIFSVQLQQTEISEGKLFIFHLRAATSAIVLWSFDATISALDDRPQLRGVTGMEFPLISAIVELV